MVAHIVVGILWGLLISVTTKWTLVDWQFWVLAFAGNGSFYFGRHFPV